MKWIAGLLAALAIGAGAMILIRVGDLTWFSGVRSYRNSTGDEIWVPVGRDGYTTMIFLIPLFLLYPLVGLAMARRKRRKTCTEKK